MSTTTTRVHNQTKVLPPDIQQALGGLNLLLVDGFSKVRALSSEFFRRSFEIPRNIFQEVDPLADELASKMEAKLYGRAKKSIFDKRTSGEVSDSATQEEMEQTVGILNLKFVRAFSNTRAFGGVLFRRLSTTFDGFSEGVGEKSSRFSHETKMKLYDRASNRAFLSQLKKPTVSEKQPPRRHITVIETKKSNGLKTSSKYERTTLVVAFLGLALILAYLVYPFFNIGEKPILFEGLETVTWAEKMFFVKDFIPRCLEKTYTCAVKDNLVQGLGKGGCAVNSKYVSLSNCPNRCLTVKPYSDYVIQV
ncbi:hypothetical protein LCGC14_2496420 [marine sediment metagenome]|uniref:Uncharacterized protein n=1 Tax=marine sediment metagenome TaxID=412755 RepID=A0A0F9B3Z8_9ZZZZ